MLLALTLVFLNCKDSETKIKVATKTDAQTEATSAEKLMAKAIEVSGSNKINNATLQFDFRDKHYKALRQNGRFSLEREFTEDEHKIKDVLTNDGFERFKDEVYLNVLDSMLPKYSASVNSVHYFAVLPYSLDATAVNKALLDDVSIKNQIYHTVKVTFNEAGGGEDFEDVFLYWINAETFKIDYLAYSYNESDGPGLRFREAYNARRVEGIRFVDYKNYKPKSNTMALTDFPKLFSDGQLMLLSKIETENIKVILQ